MKKTIVIAVVCLFVVTFGAAIVGAAAPIVNFPPFWNLTDAQKQELTPTYEKMTELRKQMFEQQKQVIQKQVSFGNLTQEQADQRIAWMEQRIEQGFAGPGMMGRGHGMMRGGPGAMGIGPNFGPPWQR